MLGKILVIGALGNVGAEVVKRLVDRGQEVRAADLSTEKIRSRFGDSVEAVRFDFSDQDTFNSAFENVKAMFLMRPPQISAVKRIMYPALNAAEAAGVKHVVFLSLIGIEKVKFVPHYKVEEYLVASKMTWTFLRCSFFMQNLNTTHRQEIREKSEIYIPVGDAKTSFIDVRDIAEVAVNVLSITNHQNKAYDLTGPEAIDYWQAARILSETLNRKITYRNPSPFLFFLSHLQKGTTFLFALVMTLLYLSTRNGMAEPVSEEVERITGQKPMDFYHYVQDYRNEWM